MQTTLKARPDPQALRAAVIERFVSDEPVAARAERAVSQLEHAPPEMSAERSHREALQRVRRREVAPEEIEPADLQVLGVERTRALAFVAEAKAAAREPIEPAFAPDSLLGQLAQRMLDTIKSRPYT